MRRSYHSNGGGDKSKRIEPSLASVAGFNFTGTNPARVTVLGQGGSVYGKCNVISATRPPIVGREMPVDHERMKRYSSDDSHLQEYLEALQKKTFKGKLDGDTHISSQDFGCESRPGDLSRFLKKKPTYEPKTESKALPTAHLTNRYSTALEKALYFTNKYNTSQKTGSSKDAAIVSNEPESRVTRTEASKTFASSIALEPNVQVKKDENDVERTSEASSQRSIGSFLNVKDFDDLVTEDLDDSKSLNGGSVDGACGEHVSEAELSQSEGLSESLQLMQLRSLGDISESQHTVVAEEPESVSEASIISSVLQRRDEVREASYSDDFEEEKTPSSQLLATKPLLSDATKGTVLLRDQHARKGRESKRQKVFVDRVVQTSDVVTGLGSDPSPLLYTQLNEFRIPVGSFVDPKRVTSYVVSPEAINALSSYNPSVLALDELLRQQVQSTRAFVESQRRIYSSTVESLRPDHLYTTLESAKKLITDHKGLRTKVK